MSEIININCNTSSYVDRQNYLKNYSNSNYLFTGIINNHFSDFNLCKTLLSFDFSNINVSFANKAFLYLYIEKMQFQNSSNKVLGIIGNFSSIDYQSVNWDNFPVSSFTKHFKVTIPDNSEDAYIKIDITSIFKELIKYDSNYNIILTPINSNYNSIVKFSSHLSNNSPYIELTADSVKPHDEENTNNSSNSDKDSPSSDWDEEIKFTSNNTKLNIDLSNPDSNYRNISENGDEDLAENSITNTISKDINININSTEKESDDKNIVNNTLENADKGSNKSEVSPKHSNIDLTNNKFNIYSSSSEEKNIEDDAKMTARDFHEKDKSNQINTAESINSIQNVLSNITDMISNQDSLLNSINNFMNSNHSAKNTEFIKANLVDIINNLNNTNAFTNSIVEDLKSKPCIDDIDTIKNSLSDIINSLNEKSTLINPIVEVINTRSSSAEIKDIQNTLNDLLEKLRENDSTVKLILNEANSDMQSQITDSTIASDIELLNDCISKFDLTLDKITEKLDEHDKKFNALSTSLSTNFSSILYSINSLNNNIADIKSQLNSLSEAEQLTSSKVLDDEALSLNNSSISSTENFIQAEEETDENNDFFDSNDK